MGMKSGLRVFFLLAENKFDLFIAGMLTKRNANADQPAQSGCCRLNQLIGRRHTFTEGHWSGNYAH